MHAKLKNISKYEEKMNIKLHTPKSLKGGSGMSSLKQLLLSLVATTISIALTFGTAALIENRKKEAEKHEMVMMILNDMSGFISQLADIDSTARRSFETQLSILEHPETFEVRKYEMMALNSVFIDQSSKTVENIFSSNIETVNTLGNILFAEKVSEFYLNRKQIFDMFKKLDEEVFDSEDGMISSYDGLAEADLVSLVSLCDGYLDAEKQILSQCQQMMDVSDDELADFSREREKLRVDSDSLSEEVTLKVLQDRYQRVRQAVEKGRQSMGSQQQ